MQIGEFPFDFAYGDFLFISKEIKKGKNNFAQRTTLTNMEIEFLEKEQSKFIPLPNCF
jgi:hypothetical protein